MDLTLQDEEQQIAAMAAEVLSAEAPLDTWFAAQVDAAAQEDRVRAVAAELGWIGFGAPEAVGGSGVSAVEEAVLFCEVGRYLGPISLATGAVAARLAAERNEALAGQIVGGDAVVGLVTPKQGDALWRLGAGKGELGLLVEDDRLALVALSSLSGASCLDPTASAQTAERAGMRILAEADAAEVLRFKLLVAAQQLGLAEAALGSSVAYAKLREQFGRLIGGFQAVRHRCVDMLVRCERAKAQLWFAAVRLRDGAGDAPFQVAAAARVCDDAAGVNARDNILLHGAIGATAENEGHLFLKRSMLWRQVLSQKALLDQIAAGTGPEL